MSSSRSPSSGDHSSDGLVRVGANPRETQRDIEREIDDEIAFHIAMRARDLEAEGAGPDEARQLAASCFGDAAAVAAECRRIHFRSRIMVQRLQVVLIAVLTLTIGALVFRAVSSTAASKREISALRDEVARLATVVANTTAPDAQPATSRHPDMQSDGWLSAFQGAANWRESKQLAEGLARLGPDRSSAILRRVFSRIESVGTRQQIVKAFAFQAGEPNALDVLDLAMNDRDAGVRAWAIGYLKNFALRDFGPDPFTYFEWRGSSRGAALEEVLDHSVKEFFDRANADSNGAVGADLDLALEFDERVLKQHAPESVFWNWNEGALSLAARLSSSGDVEIIDKALRLAARIEPDEAKMLALLRSHGAGAEGHR